MAISQEITRLQNAKASLKTSINAKTDSEHQITNETIDHYSDFVDSISGGVDINDYFLSSNDESPSYLIAGYIKKLPYTVDLTGKTKTSSICDRFSSLTEISFVNGENITDTASMFRSCSNLHLIDIRDFILTSLTSYTQMFGNVSWGQPPSDCLIIVKDDEQKTWMNTKFSRFTNVKTVEEYEGQ